MVVFINKSKYNARRTVLAGEDRSFPSRLEAAVFAHCRLREASGEIKDLTRYGTVRLTAAAISYKPDAKATYSETGQEFWIEAKGYDNDSRWRVIKKLWAFYGPGPLEIWKKNSKGIYLEETIIPKRRPGSCSTD